MATTMKDLMDSRRWALLASGVTVMLALVLSLGATKAFATLLPILDPEAGPAGPDPCSGHPYVTQVSP